MSDKAPPTLKPDYLATIKSSGLTAVINAPAIAEIEFRFTKNHALKVKLKFKNDADRGEKKEIAGCIHANVISRFPAPASGGADDARIDEKKYEDSLAYYLSPATDKSARYEFTRALVIWLAESGSIPQRVFSGLKMYVDELFKVARFKGIPEWPEVERFKAGAPAPALRLVRVSSFDP